MHNWGIRNANTINSTENTKVAGGRKAGNKKFTLQFNLLGQKCPKHKLTIPRKINRYYNDYDFSPHDVACLNIKVLLKTKKLTLVPKNIINGSSPLASLEKHLQ